MEVNLAIHIYISWGLGWGKYKYESLCSIPAIDRLFDQTDQSRRQVWRFIALASLLQVETGECFWSVYSSLN